MLTLTGVTKGFGRASAVADVSFTVAAGEIVGFAGPNGAGKSTTLRIACGFIDPDAGSVSVAGIDLLRDRASAQAAIGYMPETAPLYDDMRVGEYLRFRARLKGVAKSQLGQRLAEVCEVCDIADVGRRIIGHLSRGYRQRVALADAVIAEPKVLILDEPTAGLDPAQIRGFKQLLGRLQNDVAVLISSHDLRDLEQLAHRMILMAGGRIVASGDGAALRKLAGLPADAAVEDVFIALTRPAAAPAAAPTSSTSSLGDRSAS